MRISVIIPTYRPQSYIWECLDSLCQQTLNKDCFEVIIVLNGDKNPWFTDINRYIKQKMDGMNVRLVHTDTPGVSNARNIGIEAARGEYITFVDDDNWLSPSALQEMYSLVSPQTIVCCDVQCVHPTTKALSTDYLHASYLRNKDARPSLWSAHGKGREGGWRVSECYTREMGKTS